MKHKTLNSNISKMIISIFVNISLLFLSAGMVFADTAPPAESGLPLTNPLKGPDNLYGFIKNVVDSVVIPIGGVIAVLAIIYAGYLFVTAVGNEERLNTAKKTLWYAVIGAAILLGSWAIANGIEATIKQLTNL